MFAGRTQPRVDNHDRQDDPNWWYVEISSLPLHFNKEDIVYFIWKTLEKCRGLKKNTNPVSLILFRLLNHSLWNNSSAFVFSSDRKKKP